MTPTELQTELRAQLVTLYQEGSNLSQLRQQTASKVADFQSKLQTMDPTTGRLELLSLQSEVEDAQERYEENVNKIAMGTFAYLHIAKGDLALLAQALYSKPADQQKYIARITTAVAQR